MTALLAWLGLADWMGGVAFLFLADDLPGWHRELARIAGLANVVVGSATLACVVTGAAP